MKLSINFSSCTNEFENRAQKTRREDSPPSGVHVSVARGVTNEQQMEGEIFRDKGGARTYLWFKLLLYRPILRSHLPADRESANAKRD